jgi:hypothetical protein
MILLRSKQDKTIGYAAKQTVTSNILTQLYKLTVLRQFSQVLSSCCFAMEWHRSLPGFIMNLCVSYRQSYKSSQQIIIAYLSNFIWWCRCVLIILLLKLYKYFYIIYQNLGVK